MNFFAIFHKFSSVEVCFWSIEINLTAKNEIAGKLELMCYCLQAQIVLLDVTEPKKAPSKIEVPCFIKAFIKNNIEVQLDGLVLAFLVVKVPRLHARVTIHKSEKAVRGNDLLFSCDTWKLV